MMPSIRRAIDLTTKELVPNRHPALVRPTRRAVLVPRSRFREFFTPVSPWTYLAVDEQVLIRTHQHWLVPLKRMAQMAVMWPAAAVATLSLSFLAPGVWWLQVILWMGTISHQCYLAYCVLLWRNDLIIVTDRRFIRVSGVFTTTVEDRTLSLITDRALHQSFWGRVFGYGALRIESAGRHDDGATRELIKFVPNPKLIYQALA